MKIFALKIFENCIFIRKYYKSMYLIDKQDNFKLTFSVMITFTFNNMAGLVIKLRHFCFWMSQQIRQSVL